MTDLAALALSLLGEPVGYVDIGARGGFHPLIEPLASAVAVLGFEPDKIECARILADPNLRSHYAKLAIEPVALADRKGTATLYETTVSTNASLRPTNPLFLKRYAMEKWHVTAQSTVETTTLDDVIFGHRAAEPHWGEVIKIDIQGTEYETLLGARRVLQERAMFLCIEVSFCELYAGQKLFADVERLLRDWGFSFYGFDRLFHRSQKSLDKRRYWGRERIIQADAYFMKDPYDHTVNPGISHRSLGILSLFSLVTGYHDLALELAGALGARGEPLRRAIREAATLSPEDNCAALAALSAAVTRTPDEANVLIGRFVDQRRGRNDYYDVP